MTSVAPKRFKFIVNILLFIGVCLLMNMILYGEPVRRNAWFSWIVRDYDITQKNGHLKEITNSNYLNNFNTETFGQVNEMRNETQWIKYGEEDTDWALLVNTWICTEKDNDTHKKLMVYSSKNLHLNNVGDQYKRLSVTRGPFGLLIVKVKRVASKDESFAFSP